MHTTFIPNCIAVRFNFKLLSIPLLVNLPPLTCEFTTQDGKPYILSLAAGPAYDDARSQGYTLVAKSEFKDLEDMKYYDEGCEAHSELKKGAKTLGVEGVMTI